LTKDKYLAISEVCELVALTRRAVRYYEARGLISPRRDRNEVRRYSERERQRLMDIARLRRAGLSISEISQILRIAPENGGGVERTALAVRKLEARRAALAQLQQQTERVLSEVVEGALMRECASRSGSRFHAMDGAGV